MSSDGLNCWDYNECGREIGGKSPAGMCPAALETRLDGVHGGVNGGRACWAVFGTLCRTGARGAPSGARGSCLRCGFFQRVCFEESDAFLSVSEILAVQCRPVGAPRTCGPELRP